MRFAIVALAAVSAFGQTTKVFQLAQNENNQDLQEIATILRTTADIQQVSVDETARTVTVNTADKQLAMADWIVHQLDLPGSGPNAGAHEYRPPAGADDVVRVFYVTHASTPQDLQEIVTTVRSVADVRRLFVYNALKAVVARGTTRQITVSAWLMDQLNQSVGVTAPAPHEFKVAGDDVVRVFDLTTPQTPQQLQEIVTLVRSVADVPRLFVYNARRAVALRAPADRVALASWLIDKMDKPVTARSAAESNAAPDEYRLPGGADNLVRIFYLANSQSGQDRQQAVSQVRANAGIRRLFVYNSLGALAVRGTEGQVATAEKVLEEMKAR
jgi:hypothetical protein